MNEHHSPLPRSPDPIVPPVEARQGTRQKLNFRVLFTSFIAISIIFAGIYLLFLNAPHSENTGTTPAQTSAPAEPAAPTAIPPPTPAPTP